MTVNFFWMRVESKDRIMISDKVLDRFRKIPGKWHITESGEIRHLSMKDYGGSMACPLVALTIHEHGAVYSNGDVGIQEEFLHMMDMDRDEVEDIIAVSDYPCMSRRERVRLLRALKGEVKPSDVD